MSGIIFSGSLLRRQEDYRLMELVAFLRFFVYFGTYWCVQLTETSSAYDDAIVHFKVSEQSVLAERHSWAKRGSEKKKFLWTSLKFVFSLLVSSLAEHFPSKTKVVSYQICFQFSQFKHLSCWLLILIWQAPGEVFMAFLKHLCWPQTVQAIWVKKQHVDQGPAFVFVLEQITPYQESLCT